ncbi:hypothetical protein EV1_032249 [Malus domestica]
MGLHSLDVETNSLKSLVVEDCSDMVSITISAQNLKSLWYYGVLPRIVRLKNAMSLVNVVIDLRDGPGCSHPCALIPRIPREGIRRGSNSILISFKDVEALTTSGRILEWLCSGGVIFGYLDFQFNKLKSLTWVDFLINKEKGDSLACFLNACPLLENLLVEIDSNLSSIPAQISTITSGRSSLVSGPTLHSSDTSRALIFWGLLAKTMNHHRWILYLRRPLRSIYSLYIPRKLKLIFLSHIGPLILTIPTCYFNL